MNERLAKMVTAGSLTAASATVAQSDMRRLAMHFAVYTCADLPTRYVLSRNCTLPNVESDQRFGELRPCGTVRIGDDLMGALTQSVTALSGGPAYLVEDPWSTRYITALLERSN